MTSPIAFTDNVRDLSNQQGYQFEFRCERCGNGFRSAYRADAMAKGQSLLRSAGQMFGGKVRQITYAAGEWAANRSTNSAAKDKALRDAGEEVKDHFRQCRGCGDWMCDDVCWNDAVGQCVRCSPVVAEELAQLQAAERRNQMREQLRDTNLTEGIALARPSIVACPSCSAPAGGGKFCGECGSPLSLTVVCHACSHENPAGAKFCAECGAPAGR